MADDISDGQQQYQQNLFDPVISNVQSDNGIERELFTGNEYGMCDMNIEPFDNALDLERINTDDLIDFKEDLTDIFGPENMANSIQENANFFPNLKEHDDSGNSAQENANTFPDLEEHDCAGYNFELDLNPNKRGKCNWHFSGKLQKVYIKMEQPFYIEALYSPKKPHKILYIRAMMVFVDEISTPVQRCRNHDHLDHSSDKNLRKYILRSEHSNTKYIGKSEGKNISDRLALLIPLERNVLNDDNVVKNTIALKFVCQNSCIGRKQTAVILTLEDEEFRVLGKRVFNVRVSCCPKRDKKNDEERYGQLKRPSSGHDGTKPTKIPSIIRIKQEQTSNFVSPPSENIEFMLTQSQSQSSNEFKHDSTNIDEVTYSITLPRPVAIEASKDVFNLIAGKMALEGKNSEKYTKYLRDAKKKMDELRNTS